MIALNLTAATAEHTILKDYLENNISETLAGKINNGIRIEKDGKTLINKKDLNTFMNYACDEAKKQAEKGAKFACIEHNTVFGWAIHYFEEASIEGILYNEDGTEYKKPKPVVNTASKTVTAPVTAAKPKPQMSLFDLTGGQTDTAEQQTELTADNEPDENETDNLDEAPDGEQNELIKISETEYADKDGVLHSIPKQTKNTIPEALSKLFGDTLIAR